MFKVLKDKKMIAIFIVSILYLVLIVFDVPFIRGIYDPIFPSNWPYYYVNTWAKIWMPIASYFIVVVIFLWGYKNLFKRNLRTKLFYWIFFILSIFVLQISYVYFSRFGITVLFQRIVNPGMNGYFSSAVKVETSQYLSNFSDTIDTLDQHARDHPPGSILLIKSVNSIVEKLHIGNVLIHVIPVPDGDVRIFWDALSVNERVSAILLAFFYHLTAASNSLLFYVLSKIFFKPKIALSLAFLSGFIPSVSFFALKFDPFYLALLLVAAIFFTHAVKSNSQKLFYLAGAISSVGLFFSYSIIPALVILYVFLISVRGRKYGVLLNNTVCLSIGFLIPILLFSFMGYNSFSAFLPIVNNQAPRSYLQWVFYNPFDFFQYFGVPLTCLFFICVKSIFKSENNELLKKLMISFSAFFILLVLFGISRAEVGRIWMPLMIFPLLAIGFYQKISIKFVIMVSLLLFIQNIIMTEFWVPVW